MKRKTIAIISLIIAILIAAIAQVDNKPETKPDLNAIREATGEAIEAFQEDKGESSQDEN
jgi:hypothetical protein